MRQRLRAALHRRSRSERGAFTAMAILLIVMLLVVAGLVVDGGTVLNARAQTYDDLEQAARLGANQINEPHLRATGEVALIDEAARSEAQAFLQGLGRDPGYVGIDVEVNGTEVTVSASRNVPTRLLSMVLVESIPVQGSATADAQVGIDAPFNP